MVNYNRPYIICHMMSTIDGKIASGIEGIDILNDYFNYYVEIEKKLDSKVWMCGRVTSQIFAESIVTPLPPVKKVIKEVDYLADYKGNTYLITIDTRGKLRWKSNKITLSNHPKLYHLIVIVSKETSQEYLAYLQKKNISYIYSKKPEIDFFEVMKKLKEYYNIEKILLEGGAILNGSIMTADLVDEISLLITPLVLNKVSSPSVFERNTNEIDIKKYKLFALDRFGDSSVWLRYKRKRYVINVK